MLALSPSSHRQLSKVSFKWWSRSHKGRDGNVSLGEPHLSFSLMHLPPSYLKPTQLWLWCSRLSNADWHLYYVKVLQRFQTLWPCLRLAQVPDRSWNKPLQLTIDGNGPCEQGMNGNRLSIAQYTLTACMYRHGCVCVTKVGNMLQQTDSNMKECINVLCLISTNKTTINFAMTYKPACHLSFHSTIRTRVPQSNVTLMLLLCQFFLLQPVNTAAAELGHTQGRWKFNLKE